jgi:hypothetical protein
MPTTQTYYDQLIINSNAAATAKKDALDKAYERMTTATFDDQGNVSYKKDAQGNPLYGSMDVDYMQKKREAGAGAESSGMLRSGQYARTLAEGQAAYRSGVLGAKESTTSQKTQVDLDTAQKQAEYKALYGNTSSGGGTGAGTKTEADGKTGMTEITEIKDFTTNLTPSQQKGLATRNTVPGGFGATKTPTQATSLTPSQQKGLATRNTVPGGFGATKTPTQATSTKPIARPKPVTTKPGQRVMTPGRNIR